MIKFQNSYTNSKPSTTELLLFFLYCEKFSRDILIPSGDFFSSIKSFKLCILTVLPDFTSTGSTWPCFSVKLNNQGEYQLNSLKSQGKQRNGSISKSKIQP